MSLEMYKILSSDSETELEAEVNEYLTRGWVPAGGVVARYVEWENDRKGYTESATTYYQAVWIDSARQ